jgi:5-methyltetrahydrofolate--homocysteine methyltransferase
MNSTTSKSSYLDILKQKVIIFDGAMGTSLQTQNLTASHFGGEKYNGCNDYLNISYPEAVEKVHQSFLEAGVDVIETNTFRSSRLTLTEYDLQDQTIEINRSGAMIARKLADKFSQQGHPRFVAGSMGPTGKLPSMDDPELSNISFEELSEIFREQAGALIEGGVDLLLLETSQDILEVKAAILGIQQAFEDKKIKLPIQAQVTLDTTGRMLLGTDIGAVLTILENMPIQTIGLNCSTGPKHMREPIRYLGEHSTLPISCIPNAGLPMNVDGQAVYPLKPEPYADMMNEFVEKYGVNVIGGCCGTTPEHLQLLVDKLKKRASSLRPTETTPRLASAIQEMSMLQEPRPFLIGERLNTQGSRKFKRLIMDEDFESILPIAREQVESGAHGLDLCVALTERADEAYLMRRLIKAVSPVVHVPLIFDTTELDVLEVALQTAPGRCMINSTNLESGREKADLVFSMAKRYNAAVIVLTIDEDGMAKTAQRKLEIARRLYNIAVNDHGLLPNDLVYDTLTFTLSTGDTDLSNSAIETIEGIRKIKKELPGVLTSLGVSNVSFGLSPAARAVLNSVMLFHAVNAGLDMAIVNPAHIVPYGEIPAQERELAENLIFNREPDALQHLLEKFENVKLSAKGGAADQEMLKKMTAEERLHWRILHRVREDVEADIDEILNRSSNTAAVPEVAVHTLNTVLLPAMKEVGDKFGSGELILPFVLQSAEVMKKSVAHLENFLERKEGISKGTVVLATVYGDVHDIGKNLVKTILSNNGYSVIDLGKQCPAETIISKAVEVNADAIGLSALLVSTSKQMPLIINELHRRSLSLPVLIGGAAINQRFGRRILLTDQDTFYEPGVFYCKDAFEGLATMDKLADPEQRIQFIEKTRQESEFELGRQSKRPPTKDSRLTTSGIPPAESIPAPPEWGPRVVKDMPLDIVFQYLSKKELYRLSWGAKRTRGEEWKKLELDFETRLDKMRREALQEGWLLPQAVYGYWPAQADGDDLIIYDPDTVDSSSPQTLIRFKFPRQAKGDYLCLSDYFATNDSGRMDTVAFHIVTAGEKATQKINLLQEADNYSEAYYAHGLAVQIAEAAAEYLHRHIRRELNIPADQGKRYSWGYPAIPNLEDHKKVFQLLPIEKELGVQLTSAFQMVPEQSTAAIIVHHPLAKYYSLGESRIEQLL